MTSDGFYQPLDSLCFAIAWIVQLVKEHLYVHQTIFFMRHGVSPSTLSRMAEHSINSNPKSRHQLNHFSRFDSNSVPSNRSILLAKHNITAGFFSSTKSFHIERESNVSWFVASKTRTIPCNAVVRTIQKEGDFFDGVITITSVYSDLAHLKYGFTSSRRTQLRWVFDNEWNQLCNEIFCFESPLWIFITIH